MSIAKLNQFFSKHGRIAVFLLVLLMVVPLVFLYGVEGCRDVMGGRSGAVAEISGKPVTLVEFERERRAVAFSSNRRMNNDREVAKAVIDRIMMKRKAKELGIDMVTDEQLRKEIKAIPSFQTDEKFDAKKYKEFLENNLRPRGYTSTFFEMVMRDDIIIGRVRDRLTGAVTVSEMESFVNFQHGAIRFQGQVARYPSSKYRGEIKVTDEEVAKFYEENSEDYKIKELLKAKALHFSGAELAKTLSEGSEEELKAFYDANYSKQIEVSHILKREKTPANRKALEGVIAELEKGGDFAALAKTHSQDDQTKDKGGSLGWIARDRMTGNFDEIAFGLENGAFAKTVVETDIGYHVIMRTAERPDPIGFEVQREKLAQAYPAYRDNATARETWLADARYLRPQVRGSQILVKVALVDSNEFRATQKAKAEKFAKSAKAKPAAFSTLALANSDDEATKKKGGDLGWFASGGQPEAIDKALFEMKDGEVKVVEGPEGFYVLLKTGARERTPYEEVEAQLVARQRADRTRRGREMAEEKANGFLEALTAARNGDDPNEDVAAVFAGVAEAGGYEVFESDWYSDADNRVPNIPGSTFALSREAAKLTKEAPLTEVVRSGNDFHVAVLSETKPGYLPEVLEDVPNPAAKEGEKPKQRLTAAGRRARNDLISKLSVEKAVAAAAAAREKVAKALGEGKSFAEAKGGEDFQETPEFSPRFGPTGANAADIAEAAREMELGQLSEALEVTNGAILFYLETKKLPSVNEFKERSASFASFFQRQREMAAMQTAFDRLREESNIRFGGILSFMNEPEEDSTTATTSGAG